ncbi:fungal-specific transcription factor domain-containing protein [Aspergillus multicolor]|uniref:transcription factor domain-containing protein n=1 Tax=Aspergillus multicolor TaxID=41759 RepID=UPI003CCD22C2
MAVPVVGTAPARGFRFVRPGSRLRKRRKVRNAGETGASGQGETADVQQSGEVGAGPGAVVTGQGDMLPGVAGEEQNPSMPPAGAPGALTGEEFQLTGSGEAFSVDNIWDDFGLFDSFVPNIFEAAPFLDFGLQDPLPTDMLPQTPQLPPTTTRVIESIPREDSTLDPMLQSYAAVPLATGTTPRDPTMAIRGLSPRDTERLLEMYDSEFCILPLTSDMPINPFRCQHQTPGSQGSSLLFHSVLALCCQHLEGLTGSGSAEADEHRRKALQLLDGALQSKTIQDGFHLLDPILILFTLDCTLSASGTWTKHLNRAHTLLQACGGPSALTTPRVRSQVGMLLWWDATLALLSRKGPIMDRAYLEFLVLWETQDEWSFFELTGCPRELVVHLYDLAELARQREIAAGMRWLSFSGVPVAEMEGRLGGWRNGDWGAFDVAAANAEDLVGDGGSATALGLPNANPEDNGSPGHADDSLEESLHAAQDRYHCAETWRCGLLLYLERVFKSNPTNPKAKRQHRLTLTKLARRIINHSQSCRRTSQTQKQLLLPIFLAGCETGDAEMREFVKGYCAYWGERSRYSMFYSAIVLLEEIWAAPEGEGSGTTKGKGMWWGDVVDGKTRGEILFG